MSEAAKPAWFLESVREPVDVDVSRRIDVLRFILIALIVLADGAKGITVRIGGAAPGAQWMLAVLNGHVDYVAVPLFFTISGYLFLGKFTLSPTAYLEMLHKKFISLFIPYMLFNGVLLAWLYGVGSIEMLGSWSSVVRDGIFAKFLGIGTMPINSPLWFLRDLLLVFLASPVLLLGFKEAPSVSLVTLFVLWAGLDPQPISFFGIVFAFYFGGYLARVRLPLAGVSWWQRTGAWTFVGLTTVLVLHGPLGLTDEAVRQVLFKVDLMLGLAFFWRISAFPGIRDSAILHRGARYCFFIYLAHEPTIAVLQTRLLTIWKPVGSLQQIAFYWFSGLATIGLLWAVAGILHRYVLGLYSLATGNRSSGPSLRYSTLTERNV